ncbi:NUDIX domain-containing protein [Shinella yambaruensis]|uniref:DNA mismatch repair protein MutT n=1 Tax=Shinella yambaruensis TaxID=415996 RepID=A0ABQ5ZP44_9HYPH|nr:MULTISPECIES: NUDIX domain-containing protein [Shinella]CAI0334450.1 Nudix hydrolase domain-containing protein [Rhizobiaceae bacterium]CAK7260630.1 ADP-ribose pyrophosphatase YjhB (NUDIX family) [Shinella sp. WSC3-e]MCJ8027169.1 NUDIX domain-containing protein [Shinella yambaruensis]MCU7981225.1 NUDIX domain-containing protein [Shinella yambaruensis]MDC7258776.1 NUDIX domain-containing protein [Shinella sp. YE25]
MQEEIRIAVALVTRENGDTLLVRKRGGPQFMQAGGRIRDGEVPKATLARRLHEELGILIPPSRMAPFGCFEAEAADETDHLLVAYVFRVQLEDEVIAPTSEIDEARWMPIQDTPTLPLAPLTRNHILTLFWQMQFGTDLPHQHGREAAA